ncbi:hypothetical protein G6038_09715 [Rhodococcus sp. 14C212]|uniref:hypothetical protein n=1 Tax=Rhodococcus sp. 14C212 TaxID=2711209 RepID=UPI0013EB6EF4|nr:hypothetical protein [Rhodococcus sp. 14C212]NGP05753.1 hypothetical protein [Rhodococcus sp. 14C212]
MPDVSQVNDPSSSRTRRQWLDRRCSSVDPQALEKHEKSVVAPDHPMPGLHGVLAVLVGFFVFGYGLQKGIPLVDGLAVLLVFVGVALLALVTFGVAAIVPIMLIDWVQAESNGRWAGGDLHPEARSARQAMALSMVITDKIRASSAWTSKVFDEHRARIDLDAAQRDIVKRAARIDAAAAQLPKGITQASSEVKAAAAPHVHAMSVATDALIGRVMALDNYRTETDRLAALLEDLARTEREMKTLHRIDALDPNMFDELYRDAGINDWHADQTQSSASKVAEMHRAVQCQVQALRELSTAASLPIAISRN